MSVLLTLATVATMSLVPSPVASASQASVKATPSVNVWHAPRLTKLVALARTWAAKKVPYVYGGGHGTHPGTTGGGFDCSGWVRYAYYQAFGVDFGGGTANDMIRSGRFVRTSHPVPGDVVAFNYEYGANPPSGAHVDHVGIYVGGKAPDGRPAMIDAPHTGVNLGLHGFDYGLIGYYHYKGATKADSISTTETVSKIRVSDTDVYAGQKFSIAASARTTGGSRVAGVPMKLYQRTPGGTWKLAATVRTNSAGNATFGGLHATASAHDFKVVMPGTSKYRTSQSSVVRQKVHFVLPAPSVGAVKSGHVYKITGRTNKALAGKVIRLQRVTSSGWVGTGAASVVSSDGGFSMYWRAGPSGYYRLQSSTSGSTLSQSVSSNRAIVVR